jgi:uncharacterized membrane protein YbhN (UPF0104 family)
VIASIFADVSSFADRFAAVDGRFLFAALVLQVANLGLRSLAWRNVIAAAHPSARVSYASIAGAYVAGVGLNTFTPGRAGEAVKVFLARRRVQDSSVATLGAALSLVLLFDALVGGTLVAVLWATGTAPGVPSPTPMMIAAGLVAITSLSTALVVGARRSTRIRGFLTGAWSGLAVLRTPTRYVRTVAVFQLGAWACRIGVVLFVLMAFGITPTLAAAVLVLVAGGLSTAVPVPGGGGTQQLLVAYALHRTASVGAVLSFSIGMQAGVALVNTLVGLTALMLMFRTLAPGAAVRLARSAARDAGRQAQV